MTKTELDRFKEEYRLLLGSCQNIGKAVSEMNESHYEEWELSIVLIEASMRSALEALRNFIDRHEANLNS